MFPFRLPYHNVSLPAPLPQHFPFGSPAANNESLSRFAKHACAALTSAHADPAQGDWKGKVRVELSAMFHDQTDALLTFAQQLPEWTTYALSTTFQRAFSF